MTMVVCKCPQCKAELKFNANGSQPVVRIHCPKCQNAFSVQLRKQQPAPSPAPLSQLTEQDLSPQPIAPHPSPRAQSGRVPNSQAANSPWSMSGGPSRSRSKASSSFPIMKVLLGLVGGFAALGLIAAVAVGLYWNRGSLPDLKTATKGLVGFDSPESIAKDLEQLREKVQSSTGQIPESDRQTIGASKLKEFQPEFDNLFLRSCKLSTISRSLEQMNNDRQKMEDTRKQLQQQPVPQFNDPNREKPFWMMNLSARHDDLWQGSLNRLVEAYGSSLRAIDGQVEYPNPLQSPENSSNLTDEERRLLAVYWLQGKAARTFVQQFADLVQQDQLTDDQLKPIFDTIDSTAKEAIEVAKIPSAQGSFMIDVPKGTMYEYQSKAAVSALMHLMAKVDRDQRPSREQLKEVMGLGLRLTEKLEDIQFGRAEYIYKLTQQSSWSLFLQHRQEVADRNKAAEQEQERERLAAVGRERAVQEAAEKRRREEEARAQKMAEDRAKEKELPRSDSSDVAGSPTSPGMRPNGGMGFPGNRGPGLGGPGFGGPGPRDPGGFTGPDFSGPRGGDGSNPPRPNFGGGQPPNFQPPKMSETGVTILIDKVDNKQHEALTDEVQKSFPNHIINTSGGRMTIKITSFDHPLTEIARMMPLLTIDSIDDKTRTVRARVK